MNTCAWCGETDEKVTIETPNKEYIHPICLDEYANSRGLDLTAKENK